MVDSLKDGTPRVRTTDDRTVYSNADRYQGVALAAAIGLRAAARELQMPERTLWDWTQYAGDGFPRLKEWFSVRFHGALSELDAGWCGEIARRLPNMDDALLVRMYEARLAAEVAVLGHEASAKGDTPMMASAQVWNINADIKPDKAPKDWKTPPTTESR